MEPIMQRFVRSLKEQLTVEQAVALESCLDCRNCGTACIWYLGTGDDRHHPWYRKDLIRSVYRRHLTLGGRWLGALGLIPTPTVADLRERMDAFWKCSACGRCTLACPLNLSTRSVVRLARAAYCDAGLSGDNPTLRSIVENTRDVRHSFGLTRERVFLRLGYFLLHENVELPVGVPGAEYLFICPTAGNSKFPDYAIQVPKLLNAGGVSYTISPNITDTGTEIDHIVVHRELSRRMLMEVEDEAERLGVKKILVAECGCDAHTFLVEAPRTLGRELKFPAQSIDSLLLTLVRSGRIPVERLERTMTFHDPCYVTRLSGIGETPRRLLRAVAKNVIEMTPNREYNYCCGGGSGPWRLPENAELLGSISEFKARQIRATRAEWVVTPCAVCMLTLTDICRTCGLTTDDRRMAYMLFEVVYMAAERALSRRGETDRMRRPAELETRDAGFIKRHSLAGILEMLAHQPGTAGNYRWLIQDEVVQRYLRNHPGAERTLKRMGDSLQGES